MATATATAMVTAMETRYEVPVKRGLLGPVVLGVTVAWLAFPAVAGEWVITPSIAVTETASDNVTLSSTRPKSDLTTDINPGIRIEGTGGRSKLRLNYQLHNLFYANDSTRNRTQNSLSALGTLEAVEDWFFIDATGNISQQSISAFGGATSSDVNTNDNDNTTETSTYSISPSIRGVLGGFADYQLRYKLTTTGAKQGQAFDSDTEEWTGSLKGVTGLANLGWSLDASRQANDFGNGRSNEADLLRGVLTYQVDPQFRVSLIGGIEANDYLTLDKESHTTKGAGFEWAPTERTQIAASRERRFFGDSNRISFSHRTGTTAWKYSESKDATVQANQTSAGLSAYDLLFSIYSALPPCSLLPPEQIAACANNLALNSGVPLNTPIAAGFLTSGITLQHRREMSFALLGSRNTVTFAASQSDSERLARGAGTGLFLGDDFENVNNIRQRTASINWSHKLTAISSLTGSLARMVSTGTGGTRLETTQNMFNVHFTTRLGPNTSAGLSARRIVVEGTTNYTENALTGTLSHQF